MKNFDKKAFMIEVRQAIKGIMKREELQGDDIIGAL